MLWKAEGVIILKSPGVRPTICLARQIYMWKGMKILFTCAFIELLATYDNANHASYLLNFFPARYKHCSGIWKFSQPSRKNNWGMYMPEVMFTASDNFSQRALTFQTLGNFLRYKIAEICKISRSLHFFCPFFAQFCEILQFCRLLKVFLKKSTKFCNFAEFHLLVNLKRVSFVEICKITELRNFLWCNSLQFSV
jgi:hypothetical protein